MDQRFRKTHTGLVRLLGGSSRASAPFSRRNKAKCLTSSSVGADWMRSRRSALADGRVCGMCSAVAALMRQECHASHIRLSFATSGDEITLTSSPSHTEGVSSRNLK